MPKDPKIAVVTPLAIGASLSVSIRDATRKPLDWVSQKKWKSDEKEIGSDETDQEGT